MKISSCLPSMHPAQPASRFDCSNATCATTRPLAQFERFKSLVQLVVQLVVQLMTVAQNYMPDWCSPSAACGQT